MSQEFANLQNTEEQTECTIYGAGDAEIQILGERLRQGKLVSFPTETVYGLGANALNNAAAKHIYTVKGRPATDPLIVHINNISEAIDKLWDVSPQIKDIATCLFSKFAPGPFTLVAKASAGVVADVVTGGSGSVGLRVPAHPIARALIDAAGVPICAPSANTFGHVSPTIAEHVYFDLASRDAQLSILDGGRCSVGVESTVARIYSEKEIEILRRGAVSHEMIAEVLQQQAQEQESSSATTDNNNNNGGVNYSDIVLTIKDTRKKAASGTTPMASPGQLLTHYSPFIPAFLVDVKTSFVSNSENCCCDSSGLRIKSNNTNSSGDNLQQEEEEEEESYSIIPLSQLIVIDWGDIIAQQLGIFFKKEKEEIKKLVKAYKSLSASKKSDEASREVFSLLRWTENIDGAKAVVIPLVTGMIEEKSSSSSFSAFEKSLLEAVEDRLFRAASGRVANFVVGNSTTT